MKHDKKIGLALSGGGYRAAAFHIGTLKALKNLGLLDKIDVISSVSGGSITAAYYALHKDDPNALDKTLPEKLKHGVMLWVWSYVCFILLLILAALVYSCVYFSWWGLLSFIPISVILFSLWYYIFPLSMIIEQMYKVRFFGNHILDDLPSNPTVSINTTDLATSNQFYFSKEYVGSYRYKYDSFNASELAISKAVMASSCVPFGFSPIRIPKKFFTSEFNHKETPLLFDGGLYDNQGTHCLTDPYSKSECDYVIASVAGNTTISNKLTLNPFLALWKTSNVLMTRIKNIQVQENLYKHLYPSKRFAYVDLSWDCTERLLQGFVDALIQNNVCDEVIKSHHISEDLIKKLKNTETSAEARNEIIAILKENTHWEQLLTSMPSATEHSIAYKVSTNLTGLSEKQINALIKHAAWMTDIQVRLYLPILLNE